MSRKSIFIAIARYSCKRYKLLILVSLILSILSGITFKNLSIDSDVLNLIPENNEFTRTFKETYEEFGSFYQLILAVTIPENRSWAEYVDFIEELSRRLIEKPTINTAEYKIPELFSFFRSMFEKGILFLNPEADQLWNHDFFVGNE